MVLLLLVLRTEAQRLNDLPTSQQAANGKAEYQLCSHPELPLPLGTLGPRTMVRNQRKTVGKRRGEGKERKGKETKGWERSEFGSKGRRCLRFKMGGRVMILRKGSLSGTQDQPWA